MQNISTFIFQGWEIVGKEKNVLFHYTLIHKEKPIHFTDTLVLPKSANFKDIPQPLLDSLLNNMLLMQGISYWKLYCPKDIQIASFTLTKEQAEFWNTVYTKGLGEFFYKNKIDYRGLIRFPASAKASVGKPVDFPRENRSLLPIGGGKDSIVAAELLKKAEKPFTSVVFYTGLYDSAQKEVAEAIGAETLVVKRILDPQLFELNKAQDTYNGHIPVVAIYSFMSVFLAALFDYAYVIFANEESANYGNVEYLGEEMNHQWSKTLEFETLFQEYLATFVTKDIQYFSLLRPLSEIKIAQLFTEYPQYFPYFVSCNRGYTIARKGKTMWCGECPKCAFVFLLLAAFLPKEKVVKIFGKNLFEDAILLPLYKELLGIEAYKPFECVGTPEEVKLAFSYAYKRGEWNETVVMKFFIQHVLSTLADRADMEKAIFTPASDSIPEELREVIGKG